MVVKFVKYVEDPCFGEKHDQSKQCEHCWVSNSCHTRFRNRK